MSNTKHPSRRLTQAPRTQPCRLLCQAQKRQNPRKAVTLVPRKARTDKPSHRPPMLLARPIPQRVWLGKRDLRNKNWLYLQRLAARQQTLPTYQTPCSISGTFNWLAAQLRDVVATLNWRIF